ncbi:MAG: TolC family protein, partial [Bacteroidota bacterium]
TLQQIIFSEQVWANLRIQRHLVDAEKFTLDQQVLDVILDVTNAYFQILQAKTNVKIQQDNLDASRKNLDIAQTRNAVGYSGVADVYRLESEVANATQQLVEARNGLLQAKLQLARLLNWPDISAHFDVKDAVLTDSLFAIFDPGGIGQLVKNQRDLEIFSDFLVQEAMERQPILKQLATNKKILDRQLLLNQRAFTRPTVSLQGQANYVFLRGGAGSEVINFIDPTTPIDPINFNWNIALNVSYPIFQGQQRKIDLQQTRISQYQLSLQDDLARQQLTQGVRAQVLDLMSRSTNLRFTEISATNATRNFSIVQDSYSQGQVSITRLIDAQQAVFQARLGYANAVYQYLVSFIQLEYNVGFFSIFTPEDEMEAFVERLTQYFTTQRNTPNE